MCICYKPLLSVVSKELLNNIQEQQKLFTYVMNIRPDQKKIFSKKPVQLKKLIQQLGVKNLSFFTGNEDSIDLVIKFIEYLQAPLILQTPEEIESKERVDSPSGIIISTLLNKVDFQSSGDSLYYLMTFIIDPQNIDKYDLRRIASKYFEGKKEIVYGIMLPLLRILKEKYKLKVNLSEELQYLTYGDEVDLKKIRAYPELFYELQKKQPKMRANTELVGDALEDLITQIQSIPQEQRSFFKIIIRCYSGEIEAWVSLLEYLNLYQTFPSSQKDTVQNLFMQMLLGFKGLNIRGQNTWMELKKKTMLELISKSKQKKEFFEIFEQTLPKDHPSKFSDFQDILVLFVDKNFTSLIDKVPDMMGFLIKKEIEKSQDLNCLVQLSMSFVVFNQLNESQLQPFLKQILNKKTESKSSKLESILKGFSAEFKTKFIYFQAYQSLIMVLMRFTYTNDLSVIYQHLLNSENQFESVQDVDTVQSLKYFLSINLWFKLKYLPNMHESIHLNNFFPAIGFPIYQFAERVLGEDQLNRIIPGYSKIFKESLFSGTEEYGVNKQDGVKQDGVKQDGDKQDGGKQNGGKQDEGKQDGVKQNGVKQDVFFHLVQVQREIARNVDLKSSSNLISPSVLGFFTKKFQELQKFEEAIEESFKQQPSQEEEIIMFQGKFDPIIQSIEETLQYINEKTPAIGQIVGFGGMFLAVMIGQLGFVQVSNVELIRTMPQFLRTFLASELKSFKRQTQPLQAENPTEQSELLEEGQIILLDEEKVEESKDIENLTELISNLYGLVTSPNMNYSFYSNAIEYLGALLGNEDLTNILKLVGEYRNDTFIDQKKISSLCESLLSTLADTNCLVNPNIQESDEKKKIYIKKQIGKITKFASSQNKIKIMLKDPTTNGINETVIVDGVIHLLSILMDENETQKLVLITHTIISLFHKKFEEIDENFFLLLKVTPEKTKVILSLLKNFDLSMKNPLNVLEQKGGKLITKYMNPASKRIDLVIEKVNESEALTKKDFFCLIDISGDGLIDLDEFQRFLKRTGIDLSDHKLLEIFTNVKGSVTSRDSEQTLNFAEFEKAMEYIQKQSVQLTMESLGITKEILTFALIYLLFLVVILFAFILVGIQAFSVPTIFGSVINSLFPIIGGGGVTQARKADVEELFDPRKLKEITQKCMKIIQQMKI